MAADADPGFEDAAQTARRLLATMWRIRALEERLGRDPGGEAVAAGVCHQLRAGEPLYLSEQPHGAALAKGVPMARLLSGPLEPTDLVEPAHGLLGASGPAGTGLAEAVGSALADRAAGRQRPVVALFGDAAAGGPFVAAVRLAACWGLPVLFVCQRRDPDGACTDRGTCLPRATELVAPFHVASTTVDGGDAAAVHDAAAGALAAARDGDGPFLLECLLPRLGLAGTGDPRPGTGDPRPGTGDPIARLCRQAATTGWFSPADAASAEAAARVEVEAALRAIGSSA